MKQLTIYDLNKNLYKTNVEGKAIQTSWDNFTFIDYINIIQYNFIVGRGDNDNKKKKII